MADRHPRGFNPGAMGWIIICPFVAVITHLVFAYTLWPDSPTGLYRLAQQESDKLSSVLGERTKLPALTSSATTQWMATLPQGQTNTTPQLAALDAKLAPFAGALGVASWLVALRFGVVLLALPLFALIVGVGMADGIALRALRRAGGARESSFVYHRAKQTAKMTAVTACYLYLILPFPMDPRIIMLPTAVVLAIALRTTTGYFKKYL